MLVERDPLGGLLRLRPAPIVRDLHTEQKRALRLLGRWRAVIAGRRSGKSYMIAVWLLGGKAGQVSLYCARTLKSAKAILLPVFAELNARYQLGLTIRTVEGEVIEPNGHVIRFHGLKDRAAADLLLGQKFRRVAVDECGAFDSELLEYCITKVLQPTLFDVRGDMMICGTPGPVPKGLFYDLVGDPCGKGTPGRWPSHGWDLRQNPHIGDSEENIREILEANGWSVDNATFQREIFGRWINDAGSLIYRYQGLRDVRGDIIWTPVPTKGKTVLAVDFAGSDEAKADDCAFVVCRQDYDTKPHVSALEALPKHGINITQIAAIIRQLKAKWGVNRVVADCGALGAGFAKELRESHNLDVEAADKRDKYVRISRCVAMLDTRTLHLCAEASALADQWLSLAWDAKRRTHHESCADDLTDALLYALGEFSAVELPSKVVTQITEAQAARIRAERKASSGGRSRL